MAMIVSYFFLTLAACALLCASGWSITAESSDVLRNSLQLKELGSIYQTSDRIFSASGVPSRRLIRDETMHKLPLRQRMKALSRSDGTTNLSK